MVKFIIITPCSRKHNLALMHESILNGMNNTSQFIWCVVHDAYELPKEVITASNVVNLLYKTKNGVSGNEQRNIALDFFLKKTRMLWEERFVYFLDDDTIMHPYFSFTINRFARENTKMITFDTRQTNNEIWVSSTTNPKVGTIDSGSFVTRANAINDIRWRPQFYEADGYFAQEVFLNLQENELVAVPETAGYYNVLR